MQTLIKKCQIPFHKSHNIIDEYAIIEDDGHPESFQMKVCTGYTAEEQNAKCICGLEKWEHIEGDEGPRSGQFRLEPTNAYGSINFRVDGRHTQSKYIRLSDDTDPQRVIKLFTKHWKLSKPKILISVTGGAKDFNLSSKLKKVFAEGLRKVVETTKVWVISGGTNTGIMREVGKALQGLSRLNYGSLLHGKKRSKASVIGIASWGALKDRGMYCSTKHVLKFNSAMYRPSKLTYPDNNYSYFLFVDDGFMNKYGGEIRFRAQLEKEISRMNLLKGVDEFDKVPTVLLVVEGGPNTLRQVEEALNCGIPVVVLQNSGRAADLLSDVVNGKYDVANGEDQVDASLMLHDDIGTHLFGENVPNREEKIAEVQDYLKRIASKKNYITIFNIEESTSLDVAILKSWIKYGNQDLKAQLKVAIVWNRVDIAWDFIKAWKGENKKIVVDDLKDLMKTVLKRGRITFFELLTSNGVDINNFLTTDELVGLYKARVNKGSKILEILFGKIKEEEMTIDDVDKIITKLIGGQNENRYRPDSVIYQKNNSTFKYPFHELFIWAVVNNMQLTAIYFWDKGDESMAKALIACRILRRLHEMADHQGLDDLANELDNNHKEFEKIAVCLLRTCFHKNEYGTEKLLKYELKYWGKETCLQLAVAAHHKEFIAYSGCQKMLSKIWNGDIEPTNLQSLKVVIAILFPPIIPWLKYRVTEEECMASRPYQQGVYKFSTDSAITGVRMQRPIRSRRRNLCGCQNGCGGAKTNLARFCKFYNAPITKFWGHTLAYLAFLCLFGSVVLLKLPPKPSIREWILLSFVVTLAFEEMRQVIQSHGISGKMKLLAWVSQIWNLCDAAGLLVFFIGIVLRCFQSTLTTGHVVLSLDICIWIIRLLDIFSINKYLGPYIFMIGRMCSEMLYFLFIMAIFLLAYGVLRYSVLEPSTIWHSDIISQILFKPYFQIYGELFLEEKSQNITVFGTPKLDSYGDSIIVFALGIYLLIANILLLNLLIAIFNNIFTETQAHSVQLWGYNRYYLVDEYKTKPSLVPPFIIISHIMALFKHSLFCKDDNNAADGTFKEKIDSVQDLRELMSFEELCVNDQLGEVIEGLDSSQHKRLESLKKIERSIKNLCKQLKDTVNADANPMLWKRFLRRMYGEREEGRITPTNSHDDLITDISKQKIEGTSEDEDSIDGDMTDGVKLVKKFEIEETTAPLCGLIDTHRLSRTSPYPGTTIQRIPLADGLVSWKVQFKSYTPLSFTADSSLSDKAQGAIDPSCVDGIHFNKVDGNVDRRSQGEEYEVVDGYPRNPKGRTGLGGRGRFRRWGPNHRVDPLITRWRKDNSKYVNMPVLQFLMVKRSVRLFLPSGMIAMGESIPRQLYSDLCTMMTPPGRRKEIPNDELDILLNQGFQLYAGYVDNTHNTDNAWLETTVVNFHDEEGELLDRIKEPLEGLSQQYCWQDSDCYMDASSLELEYMRSVAQLRNADFYDLL